MTQPALDNLVRIGQLKAEPRNDAEARRMLAMARTRLADAQLGSLSAEGRFTSAYNAAHAAALAALRWHGYRSENRYTVFQCLPHTLGWTAIQWRILDNAHQKRNLAEYKGFLEVEESDHHGAVRAGGGLDCRCWQTDRGLNYSSNRRKAMKENEGKRKRGCLAAN